MLMRAGLEVGIITGGNSIGVEKRFSELGIKHIYMGNEDKRKGFDDVLAKTGLKPSQALYMGDEFFDIPILKQAGFSATVKAASIEVQDEVDYVCERDAGMGAVREVIDMLRYVRNIVPTVEGYNA